METLQPISDLEPAFSGIIRYTRTIKLDKVPANAFFRADSVFEVMRISVNGKDAGIRMTPPYQTELTGLLKKGENVIIVLIRPLTSNTRPWSRAACSMRWSFTWGNEVLSERSFSTRLKDRGMVFC